jgi:hypothetical protein
MIYPDPSRVLSAAIEMCKKLKRPLKVDEAATLFSVSSVTFRRWCRMPNGPVSISEGRSWTLFIPYELFSFAKRLPEFTKGPGRPRKDATK